MVVFVISDYGTQLPARVPSGSYERGAEVRKALLTSRNVNQRGAGQVHLPTVPSNW